uniref:Xaa-Pro aminopeptidase ApepP-like n=1 Tax=Diabrotica virgifera virgifera TaxID=50390 RepID=A0A6P7GWA3_DIAVI
MTVLAFKKMRETKKMALQLTKLEKKTQETRDLCKQSLVKESDTIVKYSNDRFTVEKVGQSVGQRVGIPEVNRAEANSRNIIAIIISVIDEKLCKLGNKIERNIIFYYLLFSDFTANALYDATFSQLEEDRRNGELRKACAKHGHAVQPARRLNSTERLIKLREAMVSEVKLETSAIQAYFITSSDEHQSTEVADYDKLWSYISGFTGSYTNIIVTANKAALWTDGRFHLQADEQIDCNWLLFREGHRDIPTMAEWIMKQFPHGSRLGLNPKLVSHHMWNQLEHELKGSRIQLVALNVSLVDIIWPKNERPEKINKEAFFLEEEYTGTKPTATLPNQKMVTLRRSLNIFRNQLVPSDSEDPPALPQPKVVTTLKEYDDIWSDLGTLSQRYHKVLIPSHCVYSAGASHAIYEHIFENRRMLKQSPIIYLKAVKNEVEIKWMHYTSIRDAAAVCDCFAYIKKKMGRHEKIMESDLVQYLNEYRYEQNHSLGNSFRTRVAFASNAAFPSYETTDNTNTQIFNNSTVVLDSGGQYYGGTTEVTRTLHFGEPTDQMQDAYTRVLIGLMQLSTLTFPSNMKMAVADAMARASLWEAGLDYLHETGHGIGSFLGVHESPIKVHFNSEVSAQQVFKPGYFLSNAPGYYKEGVFGVRLGNVLQVVEKPWLRHSTQSYYGFRTITYVPFEPNLIKRHLLSIHQIKWLNQYNEQVRHLVGEELKKQNRMDGFYWMMEKTQYIPENHSTYLHSTPYLILLNIVFVIKYYF